MHNNNGNSLEIFAS